MAVECIAYCPFCHSCTCCLQVFLELFPSGPWLFGYSSKYPSDSLIRNLARSSCAWPVDGGVMLLPLTDNAPNWCLLEDSEVVKYVCSQFHFHVLQQSGCEGLETALCFYPSLDVCCVAPW